MSSHSASSTAMTSGVDPADEARALDDEETGFEYLLNVLRLPEGFSATAFCTRTGLDLERIEAPLRQAEADGLIAASADGVFRPTALGFRFLNDLQARFLP